MELMHLLTFFGNTGGESGGIAALGIDPLAILAQAATFLVLFLIIKKFALDKIFQTLEERRNKINEGVELGLEMELEKQKLEEDIKAKLLKVRHEADEIIAGAHTESGAIIKEAEAKAAQKVDMMLADAHNRIEEDIKRARRELEKDVLALVSDATEVIIEEKLDAKKDATLIGRALGRLRS